MTASERRQIGRAMREYDGERIVGFQLDILFDVTAWRHWCLPNRYGRCLGLGPLRIWFSGAYDQRRPSPGTRTGDS